MKSTKPSGPTGLSQAALKNVTNWLEGNYPSDVKAEIEQMFTHCPEELSDAFGSNLSFGTGGMRGIMGLGTARMNPFTVASAVQGIANYLNKQKKQKDKLKVVIGCDTRNQSYAFAKKCACVFAGNGIEALLFQDFTSTPFVSFACREEQCDIGIMVTASHNPPEYNGLKVYWSDGGQVLPPHDQGIINEVNKVADPSLVKEAPLDSPLIKILGQEYLEKYLSAIEPCNLLADSNRENGKKLKVIYTPLHGVGGAVVPQVLKKWGFTNLAVVEPQMVPNGGFPTVKSPNPEDYSALSMAIDLMEEVEGDLVLANDPDADRLGIAISHYGEVKVLTGNQIAAICTEHILSNLNKLGLLELNSGVVKSVVTTELISHIAKYYGCKCYDVLTGFKYVGQRMTEWEGGNTHFLFGAEESLGYLFGTHARDKDGVVMTALICEMALAAKLEGKTLYDLLLELYIQFGVFREKVLSVQFEDTLEAKEKMDKALEKLREHPPETLGGLPLSCFEDYHAGIKRNFEKGKDEPLSFPETNMLRFSATDGSSLFIRPSGTEPKVKIYAMCVAHFGADVEEGVAKCDAKVEKLLQEGKKYLISD